MLSPSRLLLALRLLALTLIGFFALRIAWVSDDALITLRSALNISHGWGPGFNATEAVQAYTHPLWFLLWLGIGNLTNQWMLGILVLSAVLTVIAVGLLLWRTTSIPRTIVIAALLLLSNAFMDYSSSGLENSLAYVGVGLLLVLSARSTLTWRLALLVGLTAAAILLTRLDLALLIAPVLAALVWQHRRELRLIGAAVAALAVPLIIWFAWTKATYSAWLPSTFEAKRNVTIPATDLASQGVIYLWVTFAHDPVTLIALAGGLVLGFLSRSWLLRSWAFGVVLYVAYVVWIGGDFMAGRFVAVPVYVCIAIIAMVRLSPPRDAATETSPAAVGAALGVVIALFVGTAAMGSPPGALLSLTQPRFYEFNIADERGIYSPGRNLTTLLSKTLNKYDEAPKRGDLYSLNAKAAMWPDRIPGEPLAVTVPKPTYCVSGAGGIEDGPLVHFIDPCGLTDRYLAETPYTPEKPFLWRMGHFPRFGAPGYWEAVVANDPSLITDPAERARLEELWVQIR